MQSLSSEQEKELSRMKAYFPYRIVYGAISPSGEFVVDAVANMRKPNKLSREGWSVFVLK